MSGEETNLLTDMITQLVQSFSERDPVFVYTESEFGIANPHWESEKVEAKNFANRVSEALADGPVVAMPPWSGASKSSRPLAGDVLRDVEPSAQTP